jgi:hypothetical protein
MINWIDHSKLETAKFVRVTKLAAAKLVSRVSITSVVID